MSAKAILFGSFLLAMVDCPAQAQIPKACDKLSVEISDAAAGWRVPRLLLTAVAFSESTCDPSAVNETSDAIGAFQILPGGSAAQGHSAEALADPWLNTWLAAAHLAKWKKRCGTWLGAVTIFHGNERCRARSGYAASVIRLWKTWEKQEEARS